jgi:hypothetical protein
MLQTDVMRFFAILCLCLMAIFALVKALPISSQHEGSPVANSPDLEGEAAVLQQKIASLREKLAETRSDLRAATAAVEKSTVQAARAAAIEEKAQSRLSLAEKELTMVSRSLEGVRNEIERREAVLANITKDIDDKRQIRSALQTQMDKDAGDLQAIKAMLEQATAELDQSLQQKQDNTAQSPVEPVAVPSIKKGFTLRFASDTALNALIDRATVRFFALANNKAWQLKRVKERPIYIAVPIPPKIYEMETATVPVDYADVFSRQVAASARSKVTWGVTLPEEMAAIINQLIKKREGGDLIIMPDGEVIIN